MQYILRIKDLNIPFTIKNYKTAKSIKIYFKEGVLTVTKSPYIPKKEVDKLITLNEQKIYEEYKRIIQAKETKKGRWETGEIILYHGNEYVIDISYHNKDIVRVKIEKETKRFCILLPKQIGKDEEEPYIKKAVRMLFKDNTEVIIQERLPYWSKKTNIQYNSVKVRDAKTKYGSCIPQKKALHFSSRLVMLPNEAIDAVIVHELCHIIHPNHSKEFYSLVEKYIPNYKEIDKYLKKNGSLITI